MTLNSRATLISREKGHISFVAWEQDERQLLTASNEGMSGGNEGLHSNDDNRLGDVVTAKDKINEKPQQQMSH